MLAVGAPDVIRPALLQGLFDVEASVTGGGARGLRLSRLAARRRALSFFCSRGTVGYCMVVISCASRFSGTPWYWGLIPGASSAP